MPSFISRSIAEQSAEEKAERQRTKVQRINCFFSSVSFSGPCPGESGKIRVSCKCGGLAQLGERLPCKQEVSGSIPLISTTYMGG